MLHVSGPVTAAPLRHPAFSAALLLLLPAVLALTWPLAGPLAASATSLVMMTLGLVMGGLACWLARARFAMPAFVTGLLLLSLAPLAGAQVSAAAWYLPLAALLVLPLLGQPVMTGVAALLGFGSLTAAAMAHAVPLSWPMGLAAVLYAGLLLSQTLVLRQAQRERFDIEFLVRAMGLDGTIRLDFGVVRAESEIGQRLKQVQERMAALLGQVRGSTRLVQEQAHALRQGGEQLRERTETGASGLRDAAMTLEQITTIVQGSADAAAQARTLAVQASQQAREGAETFSQVAERMQDIDKAARRITEIVSVIDGIAFQTNILALNAAVEAARAGEHGRGFAVVASEVRGLALRASEAAGQVKTLIEAASSTTRAGSELVRQADGRIQALVHSVVRVGDVFAELSADTQQHAGSIDAVTRGVMELDQLTRLNVALVETTQSVAASLLEHGEQLEQHLSGFRIGGHESPPARAPSLPGLAAPVPGRQNAGTRPPAASRAAAASTSNERAKAEENVQFF